jgi:hypothetical protein
MREAVRAKEPSLRSGMMREPRECDENVPQEEVSHEHDPPKVTVKSPTDVSRFAPQ